MNKKPSKEMIAIIKQESERQAEAWKNPENRYDLFLNGQNTMNKLIEEQLKKEQVCILSAEVLGE